MPVIAGQEQSGFASPKANLSPATPSLKSGQKVSTTPEESKGKYMSGGFLSDIGDFLSTPLYAFGGFLKGNRQKSEELRDVAKAEGKSGIQKFGLGALADIFGSGIGNIGKGIQDRETPGSYLRDTYSDKPAINNPVTGFATDVIVDPLNFAGGILAKGGGKALELAGKAEPALREFATGGKVLSNAEKLRADQIAKGGISIGEGEKVIRDSLKSTSELLSDAVGKFPVFGKAKEIFENLAAKTPKSFQGAVSTMDANIAKGKELAKETGEFLTQGLTRAQQQRVGQIMKGGISIGKEEASLRTIAALGRRTVDNLSKELVDELKTGGFGGGKEDVMGTILNNVGQYMPRMYRQFVEDPKTFVDFISGGKSARLVLDYLKKRKDIPDDVRLAMGEILEPGFPVAKRIDQITHSIETSKFFRWVNKNFAVEPTQLFSRTQKGEKIVSEIGQMAQGSATKADDLLKQGYVQLPESTNLGILAGKFVPKQIADQILNVGKVTQKGENAATKVASAYKAGLGIWKYGKVILNPATQARNWMSNVILMDLAHYPVFRPEGVKMYAQAAKDYASKGEAYQLARKVGLLGGSYYGNEIKPFLNAFETGEAQNLLGKGVDAFKKGASIPGKAYTATEETSKLAMFTWRMSKGDTAKQAADYANKWLFDYRDVPNAIRYLRNAPFGYPFITFATKSIPRVAEVIAKEPTSVSKYYKVFQNIEGQGRDEEEGILPDYIKEGLYVRLPFNDANGNSLYMNMAYIVPWGAFNDAGEGIVPSSTLPSDPASTFLIAASTGLNPFTGKPIYLDTDDPDEKQIKLATFIYQTLMPTLSPEIPFTGIKGGYSWEKMMDAILQRPDREGNIRDIVPTFFDVGFGLKAQPINPENEALKRTNEFEGRQREIQRNISNISKDQSITDETVREEKIQKEINKLEREGVQFSERFGPQF